MIHYFMLVWSRADKLALALGRQTADERIGGLVLHLMERLEKRGMAQGPRSSFRYASTT
jgi:hypothetical protein